MVVHGIVLRVLMLLKMGISLFSSGRERTAVGGTNIRVPMQHPMGISPSSNGRERMAARGIIIIHFLKLIPAASQKSSNMSLPTDAQCYIIFKLIRIRSKVLVLEV